MPDEHFRRGVIPAERPLRIVPPYDAAGLLGFLAARAVPGVEEVIDGTYRRVLALPHGPGVVALTPAEDRVRVALVGVDAADAGLAGAAAARIADVDHDPEAVAYQFAGDPVLGALSAARPGVRVPGAPDPFEVLVRAVVGQQVSVAGARTLLGELAGRFGAPLPARAGGLRSTFPPPAALAAADPSTLPMPRARGAALVALAAAGLSFDGDPEQVGRTLQEHRGVGPWTAGYVRMRGLGDPDVLLAGDLILDRALAGTDPALPRSWRPFRSYATILLWGLPRSG